MHPVEKGDLSLAMITARFLRLGYVVLRPMTENCRYDLVISRNDGPFERVQCKTGRLRSGAIKFNACSSQAHHGKGIGRTKYTGQIEFFGIYCPETDGCYLIPIGEIGGVEGSLRVEAPKNNQGIGVRLASCFEV